MKTSNPFCIFLILVRLKVFLEIYSPHVFLFTEMVFCLLGQRFPPFFGGSFVYLKSDAFLALCSLKFSHSWLIFFFLIKFLILKSNFFFMVSNLVSYLRNPFQNVIRIFSCLVLQM